MVEVLGQLRALQRYLAGDSLRELRQQVTLSKTASEQLAGSFSALIGDPQGSSSSTERERAEWLELLRTTASSRLQQLFPVPAQKSHGKAEPQERIAEEL